MINSNILAMLQAQVAQYLTDTCTIEQDTTVVDEFGGTTPAFVVVASSVACAVITIGTDRSIKAGLTGDQQTITDEYRIILPNGQQIETGWRVTVGSDVYHVTNILDKRTNETDVQVIARRQR